MMVAGYSTGPPQLRYELANMNRFHRQVLEVLRELLAEASG